MAAFMDWRGGVRTATGMMCMIGGSFLGWPFAAALIAPFMIEEFMLAYFTDKQEFIDFCYRILDGSVRSTIILVIQFCFDAFFYRRVAIVPYNIVWYNVIAARSGKGPDIYGTEPWHFYGRNLLLNFNIWFIIALAAMPLYFIHTFVLRQPVFKQSYFRGVIFLTPFYLWLAIFTVQPHKEERFMYPIYPALGFNAALGSHILLTWLGTSNPRSIIAMIPAKLRLLFAAFCFITAVDFGVWRTLGMITAYNAPLNVYKPLRLPGVTQPGDNVCLGKEWYRFPSSYHLPTGVSAKFVKSEFNGLLPGDFSQAGKGFGLYPGAWLIPSGMNDENKEDPSKYVSRHLPMIFEPGLISTRLGFRTAPSWSTRTSQALSHRLWNPTTSIRRKPGKSCRASRSWMPRVLELLVVLDGFLTGTSSHPGIAANGASTVFWVAKRPRNRAIHSIHIF